ncbi:hypothetical protein GNF10_09610 [Nostoc sp. UCD121]|uniref:hypothetical protein n=1 Tax=unclassified Nostoc TaxID=2593658 RepID=UPI0016270B60|nr:MULTISPECIES: hypothetical protein [unclassified Nostoc]MBC1224751.1 hypothetical protein [Nostoc sp. UCD120]MBC1276240.1 hypothetical protein [Nostoc sp. UCD121]
MIQSHSKPAFRNGNRFGIWQLPQLKHHLNPRWEQCDFVRSGQKQAIAKNYI